MKLSDLSPNPQNPRKITDDKLKMLKASLDNFGDLSGIVFNRTSQTLSGGHQRLKCLPPDSEIVITSQYAEKNKQGTVAVGFVFIDGERYSYREVEWDELTEKAANLAANTHGGEWDNKQRIEWLLELEANNYPIEITGLDKEEQEDIMAPFRTMPEGLTDADSVPDSRTTDIKRGELFLLGQHRLLCGDSTDSTDVARLMNGEKADMVFTDPPYNVAGMMDMASISEVRPQYAKLKASEWDQNFDVVSMFKSYLSMTDGWIYFFTQPNYFGEIDAACKERDRKTSWGTWIKRNPMPCLRKEGWTYAQEFFVFVRAKDKSFNFPSEGHAYNWWDFNTEQANRVHPTQKPIVVCEHGISHSSKPRALVLDLFLGSGSTLIACEKTNRKCYGMEIDPSYCQVIIDRWEQFTGKKAVKL